MRERRFVLYCRRRALAWPREYVYPVVAPSRCARGSRRSREDHMPKRLPSGDKIAALRDAGDVTGLIEAFEATKRRDKRRATRVAVEALGDGGRTALMDLLGDEHWQRSAGAVLVE